MCLPNMFTITRSLGIIVWECLPRNRFTIFAFQCTFQNAITNKIIMSEKGGTRVGAGRPLARGETRFSYLGMGAELKQTRDHLKGGFTAYTSSYLISLPHKAAVPIQPNDKQQTETLALPTSWPSTLILLHDKYIIVYLLSKQFWSMTICARRCLYTC